MPHPELENYQGFGFLPEIDPTLNPYCDLPYVYWRTVVLHNGLDLNSQWFRVWSRWELEVGSPPEGGWKDL